MSTSSSASNAAATTEAKAIRIHAVGGVDQLVCDSITLPAPSSTQVLIELYSCGVNYIDTYHRTGLYKLPLPATLGREGAGIVRSVGDGVTHISVGDRAVFFSSNAYASHALVDANSVVKISDDRLSFDSAVAAHLQGLTAHSFVHSVYNVKQGDTVLIHAAAGGTGNIMVQMCKIKGATVIGTVGSSSKSLLALDAGCDHVINYNEKDFVEEVNTITNKQGVHAVFDGVGASTFTGSLNCLRRRGTLCLFGNASGPVPPVDPLLLTQHGSVFLARPTMAHFVDNRDELNSRVNDIQTWMAEGKLKMRIAATFPLTQQGVREAHQALESRQYAGKIIIKVRE